MSDTESSISTTQPITADDVPPLGMDLEELLRILDVATELGQEQELVEREFNREKIQQRLRERLMETAQLTGEPLTEKQADAAVKWYYDHLHEYRDPESSFSLWLAHLYIRRNVIFGILLSVVLVGGACWALWLAPFAPFSAENIQQRKMDAEQQQIELAAAQQQIELDAAKQKIAQHLTSIRSITRSPELLSSVDQLATESRVHYSSSDLESLVAIEKQLEQTEQRLSEEFTITVVGGENQQSGFERFYEDEQGKRLSGYYVVVEARTGEGSVVPQSIRNAETDKTERVTRWAERVPRAVYERLVRDKTRDGVLDETEFAVKRRGEIEFQMIMTDGDRVPIKREAQITRW